MSKNLFATATKVPAKSAATKEKEEIDLSTILDSKGNPKYPTAGQLLIDFQKYHAQKAEAEAMLKTKGEQLKEIGLELWTEKYQESGKRPESFKMVGKVEHTVKGQKEPVVEIGKLMFISSDSYKKIDEITATVLESKYEGIIERTETFSFNNELLAKHMEAISKALMGIKSITDEEKDKLIQKTETVSIKKGTIENVNLIASITGKAEKPKNVKEGEVAYEKFEDVKDLVRSVEPTFSLKNC